MTDNLELAEALWVELQQDKLGGYSGINRPFWIKRALDEAERRGIDKRDAEIAELRAQLKWRETQRSVSEWAAETFGPAGSNCRVATRANEEMAELLRALSADDRHPKAVEEIADIVIILYRLVERFGANLHAEVDRKMATNRSRTWKKDGTGHGYHVPTPPKGDAP